MGGCTNGGLRPRQGVEAGVEKICRPAAGCVRPTTGPQAAFMTRAPFWPPNPKLVERASFGAWSRAVRGTQSRSQFGSGLVRLMVGGTTLSDRAMASATASMAPDAAIEWPIIDLMLEIGMVRAVWPKTFFTAIVSIWSLSRVLVPWALMY